MSTSWGVMRRGGALALALGLGPLGCHRHVPVGSAEVGTDGLQVAGTYQATSVAWPDGRVCTLNSGGALPVPRGHGPADAPLSPIVPPHGDFIHAFFFRLCEARANGDLSQEQYNLMVERFLTGLQRGDRTAGVPERRAQPWSRPQRDPRLWHGEDAGGLSGPARDPLAPPGAPTDPGLPPPAGTPPGAPAPPTAQPPAPTLPPPTAPNAPSTGALPDTRR